MIIEKYLQFKGRNLLMKIKLNTYIKKSILYTDLLSKDFDAADLYPTAMSDDDSLYPKLETG